MLIASQTLAFKSRIRACKWFVCCTRGATAVEFGLVATPFIAVLLALIETMLVFFAGRVLDSTTEEASRVILTGHAQQSSMTQAAFASYVCQNTFALFNCNNFMINVQNYASFAAANTATPTLTFNSHGQVSNAWNFNPGNPGDIVVVQIMYQWPIITGPLGFNLSNLSNGNRLLVSTAIFKNEPYSGLVQ